MNKRIGILTMYYDSSNYGGLLQAYSLTHYLSSMDYNACQITYDYFCGIQNLYANSSHSAIGKCIRILKKIIKKILLLSHSGLKSKSFVSERIRSCKQFRNSIPHTSEIYNTDNIRRCVTQFDTFIVGSDQVWNPCSFRPTFFLDFVDSRHKNKISYAASISNHLKGDYVNKKYKELLSDFKAISVREKSSVAELDCLVDGNVEWTIDPVFLTDKLEWEDISASRLEEEPYVFCYFLGDDNVCRQLADQYAKNHGLKLVTIPYMQNKYRKCDSNFGDRQISCVSPNGFLSLIRNAEVIFTDSFHASAFSIIFQKKFIVFQRPDHAEMGNRLEDLCDMCGCKDVFCNSQGRYTFNYIEDALKKDHDYNTEEYQQLLIRSKRFLLENI